MKKLVSLLCSVPFFLSCLSGEKGSKASVTGWQRDSTTHFRLLAQSGVPSADSLGAIGLKMEVLQEQLLATLHEKDPLRLEVYFLKDREALASYTGYPANGYTDTQKGIIYLVDKGGSRLPLRHELMHALSWRLWGTPSSYWLSEGIAVFAAGQCRGYSLHALAHGISRQGKIVPFSTLTDTFDFRALEPSLQAASMVQYIYDTYGWATLKNIWQQGFEEGALRTGTTAAEMEKQWKSFIDHKEFDAPIEWEMIQQKGCGG